MFSIFQKVKKNKELEFILLKLENNASNNYKDAAQLNLKEFEKMFEELKESGKLKEKQIEHYEQVHKELRERMNKFTHKDQVCTWV